MSRESSLYRMVSSKISFLCTSYVLCTNLRKNLPKLYQHVTCHTRKQKTLDHCYTPIKGAYRSLRRAPLGESDHNMIHLVPTYKSQLKREKPVKITVRQWSDTAIEKFQGCFECMNWDLFMSDHNLNECTDVTLDYIRFCEDICVSYHICQIRNRGLAVVYRASYMLGKRHFNRVMKSY